MENIDKQGFESKPSIELKGHRGNIHSLAWNSSGKYLASGSVDHTARIWMIDSSSEKTFHMSRELKGMHTDTIEQLIWDPQNSEQLATISADKSVCLWDTRSLACAKKFPTSGENINACWHPSGTKIAIGSRDNQVIFIDPRMWKILDQHTFPFEVNEMAWNPRDGFRSFWVTTGMGKVVVYGDTDGDVSMFKGLSHEIVANSSSCYCIDFDPTGQHLAIGSVDSTVSLWVSSGPESQGYLCYDTISRLDGPIRSLSFNHDGSFLAIASEDKFLDISTPIKRYGHILSLDCSAPVNCVSWHPSKSWLAFSCQDRHSAIQILRNT
jgi:THO complex subunit 3